jgi:hypothetical protein
LAAWTTSLLGGLARKKSAKAWRLICDLATLIVGCSDTFAETPSLPTLPWETSCGSNSGATGRARQEADLSRSTTWVSLSVIVCFYLADDYVSFFRNVPFFHKSTINAANFIFLDI